MHATSCIYMAPSFVQPTTTGVGNVLSVDVLLLSMQVSTQRASTPPHQHKSQEQPYLPSQAPLAPCPYHHNNLLQHLALPYQLHPTPPHLQQQPTPRPLHQSTLQQELQALLCLPHHQHPAMTPRQPLVLQQCCQVQLSFPLGLWPPTPQLQLRYYR